MLLRGCCCRCCLSTGCYTRPGNATSQDSRCNHLATKGYWPESLLTPPDVEAISRDLHMIKASASETKKKEKQGIQRLLAPVYPEAAGFNTVRVHAVVMGEAFYAICDQLGLLVWQAFHAAFGK